ncbi:hypothetical protein F5888DRAFT_944799 [Russula emetica]|nr:hypothetical protein F5888DRAFT_944799 [Russula emetica]
MLDSLGPSCPTHCGVAYRFDTLTFSGPTLHIDDTSLLHLDTLHRHGSHHALSPGLQHLGLYGCDCSSCTNEPEATSALCQCECTHTRKENTPLASLVLMGVLALTASILLPRKSQFVTVASVWDVSHPASVRVLILINVAASLIIPLCSIIGLLAPCGACVVHDGQGAAMIPLARSDGLLGA